MSDAATQFEDQIANILLQEGNVVIRPNSPSRGHIGFMGRRKPDLMSISPELQITVWELKSQAECNGLDNPNWNHIWFRHPTPDGDYISDIRQTFRQDDSITIGGAGWCIVLQGELAYWCHNMGTTWRHPLMIPSENSVHAGVAAPISQQAHITTALQHLGWEDWAHSTQRTVTLHWGSIAAVGAGGINE